MSQTPPRGLFVTGNDTEVGKTYVACLIAKSLCAAGVRVGVYKPAASGCRRDADGRLVADDAVRLWEAAGRPESLELVCPQSFEAPLAPHLAARREGREVDEELLVEGAAAWSGRCDLLLVEGAGGLMSPLGPTTYVADVAYELGFPLVIVARNTLGVINRTLQTAITASVLRDGLSIAGVVLNDAQPPDPADESRADNAAELRERLGPPLLGVLSHGGGWEDDEGPDWRSLLGRA